MLNQLASNLGGVKGQTFPNIRGKLTIESENPYCRSCSNVVDQFSAMFPTCKVNFN